MQTPLFEQYNIDEKKFWEEVSRLPNIYKENGINEVIFNAIFLICVTSATEVPPNFNTTNFKILLSFKYFQY